MRRSLLTLKAAVPLAVCLWCAAAWAGDISFYGVTDKDPLSYAPGETMTFTVSVLEDGQKVSGKNLAWIRRGDDGKTETGQAVSDAEQPLVILSAATSMISTAGRGFFSMRLRGPRNRPTSMSIGPVKRPAWRPFR